MRVITEAAVGVAALGTSCQSKAENLGWDFNIPCSVQRHSSPIPNRKEVEALCGDIRIPATGCIEEPIELIVKAIDIRGDD
jgi:hypothetical protein